MSVAVYYKSSMIENGTKKDFQHKKYALLFQYYMFQGRITKKKETISKYSFYFENM
jgi:hypothetical protein